MTDIVDPIQTIVSLLKNSSTGIGTTGYEVTNDEGTGLTITNGDILVSFSLAKEELRSLFGEDSDYDLKFPVEAGEIEDEQIGLNLRQYKVPVIIVINVIEKASATGSGKIVITPSLVLDKAVNALRKFIKANVKAPGGTILTWNMVTFKKEVDATTRPYIYKCTVTTEAKVVYE